MKTRTLRVCILGVLGGALLFSGCARVVTISNGDKTCTWKDEVSINAEQIATVVQPLVIGAGGAVLAPANRAAPAPQMVNGECNGKLCMTLAGDVCTVEVRE